MRVASIHTYPVKSCHRVDQDAARVRPWGLAGDRLWMVVDPDGTTVTQRQAPVLTSVQPVARAGGLVLRTPGMSDLDVPEPVGEEPIPVQVHADPVRAAPAGPAADDWLSEVLERKVRLVWLDDPSRRSVDPRYAGIDDRVSFADAYPLLLANAASLDELNGWLLESGSLEGPLPMTRFRPNVVISGARPWAEDDWTGGRIRIGTVTFRVPKPCGRCVVTTTDQETGERGHEPLRTLAKHREVDRKLLFATNLIPDGEGLITIGDMVEAL